MTSIIFRKTHDNGNALGQPDVVAGMRDAGYVMNTLINSNKPRKRVFKHLYRRMVGSKFSPNELTDPVLDAIRKNTYELTALNAASDLVRLIPLGNKYRKFVAENDPDQVIKITVVIDKADSDETDDFTHMTISVPEDKSDLLDTGYVGTVVTDIQDILDNAAGDKVEAAKQYLLANLFLSRCR